MSLLKYLSVGFSLVLVSSAAVAFQEQKAGSSPEAAPAAQTQGKPAELSAPPDALRQSLGTDVRIPGLGKLGSLPKMDFGLELLYGATDGKPPEAPSHDENREDLTIRGTVKHKF